LSGAGASLAAAVVTLVGDESYFRDQFLRELRASLPAETLELGWQEADLGETPLEAVLDEARTPSLMAPRQIFYLRNARELFGRGGDGGDGPVGKKRHGDFPANLQRFAAGGAARGAAPEAQLIFVADHVHIPADRARMSLEDKGKLQRIATTLGAVGEMVECAGVSLGQAARLAQRMAQERGCTLGDTAAAELAEGLEGQLSLMEREVEKLCLHAGGAGAIAAEAVAALRPVAGASTGYELADRLARRERAASLACLERLWAEEGESGAIGLVFQLSRVFEMALVVRQEKARDKRALYQALPEGLRPPGFAAESVLAIGQRMGEGTLRRALARLHAADVELRSSPLSARLVMERMVLALTGGV
jgi:DNA polymerase-3 subunit delta